MQGNWLVTVLEDHNSQTNNNDTYRKKLPRSNFIGAIHIRLSATINNAGNDADFVTDFLEVVQRIRVKGNGFADILDLTGKELRNIMTPTIGAQPGYNLTHKEAEYISYDFPILFGRYEHDTEYILPAKLFKTLNLEIQYNLTPITDPGFDTQTFTIDVTVEEYISDDNPFSKKIIKRTEVESDTTKSGNINVELPLGGIYKQIMIQQEDDNVDVGTSIGEVQLRINNGSEIPYTVRFVELMSMNMKEMGLPPAILTGVTTKANDDTIITNLGRIKSAQIDYEDGSQGTNILERVTIDGWAGGQLTLKCDATAALTEATDANRTVSAYTTIAPVRYTAESFDAVPECAFLVFDKNGDMSLCPDSSAFNDATVRLAGADTNATYSVCLEEIVIIPQPKAV